MEYRFNVQGMTCGHCEKAIMQALKSVDPQVTVDIDRPLQTVTVNSSKDRDTLVAAITEEGYQVAWMP
jgi:copper chaperone